MSYAIAYCLGMLTAMVIIARQDRQDVKITKTGEVREIIEL
jgi:hypothetical protein